MEDILELSHHGILGQKWGVRRFQNKDGTLTAEGKQRSKSRRDFDRATSNVVRKSYETQKSITKESISISTIQSRGGLNRNEAMQCAVLANKAYEKAKKNEPKITADVKESVENAGCKLYGLNHRLKQPTSIAAKIGSDAKEKNISFDQAASQITDGIRYTSISNDDSYVNNYNKIKNNLEKKGYSEIKCKNYFEQYAQGKVKHKAVQSIFSDGENEFELQFQTAKSQAAKELKVPLYEERRSSDVNPDRAAYLEREMIALAEKVTNPKDVTKIKSH